MRHFRSHHHAVQALGGVTGSSWQHIATVTVGAFTRSIGCVDAILPGGMSFTAPLFAQQRRRVDRDLAADHRYDQGRGDAGSLGP